MLKELRNRDHKADPMLVAFKSALSNRRMVGRKYSEQTIRSYAWHCKSFLQYCQEMNTTPRKISEVEIQKYLKKIWVEVQADRLSKPFFLQACTTLETLYRTSARNQDKADAIPRIREQIAS